MERKNILLSDNSDKLRLLGRAQVLPSGIACDHSGTGIELCLDACGEVFLTVYSTVEKEGSDFIYFTLYVDGERLPERLSAPIGESVIRVADFSDKGKRKIRIVKQSESNYNLCELRSISLCGELCDAPARRDKLIEYIGDSLSCGMGVLGKKGVEFPQSSRWEDVTQGYTYMSAEALEADYLIISESGIGLAGSWYDPLLDFYSAFSYKRDKTKKYDFSQIPDLIVINLGTNDFYLNCELGICKTEEVEDKVKELVLFVRKAYNKDIPILWLGKFMIIGSRYVEAIDRAIADLGGENAKIYRLDLTTCAGGAHGHPDIEGHKLACAQTVDFIRKNNLLKQI